METISLLMLMMQLLPFILSEETTYNLIDLRPTPFSTKPYDSFLLLNLSIKDNEVVIAYADLNNDKYTDVIVYEKKATGTDVSVRYFDSNTGFFLKSEALITLEPQYTIKNLFVTSLEPKNERDIILTVSDGGKQKTFFYCKKKKDPFVKIYEIGNSPIVIADLNGDRRVDVLYYDEADKTRKFVYFEDQVAQTKPFKELSDVSPSCKQERFDAPLAYKGNAFIDIDSNCRNDLLLTSTTLNDASETTYFEVWHGRLISNTIKYCLTEVEKLDKDFGAFSMGDFNDDGYIDLIFPRMNSGNVTILWNTHTPEFYWTQDFCTAHDKDDIFKVYDFTNKSVQSEVNLNEENKDYKFYMDPAISTTVLRVASFDSEPYPGLLVMMKNDTSNINNVFLFENGLRQIKEKGTAGKTFTLTKRFEMPDALYASFFDFDENGILDVFIVTKNPKNGSMKSIGYFNNNQKDNFFLKGQTKLDGKKFYASEIGTHYRFIATNNDGTRRMDFSYQLIQNSDLTMSLPYSLAGIGRSNNYIENYQVVSATLDVDKNREILTPIIPNSQLIITKKLEAEAIVWIYDLIVQPMDKLIMMIIIIAIILVVILVAIIILHMREKKEDRKLQENEKFSAWFA